VRSVEPKARSAHPPRLLILVFFFATVSSGNRTTHLKLLCPAAILWDIVSGEGTGYVPCSSCLRCIPAPRLPRKSILPSKSKKWANQ
jgi:hypothetical protein